MYLLSVCRYKNGIRNGDVIVKVGAMRVTSRNQYQQLTAHKRCFVVTVERKAIRKGCRYIRIVRDANRDAGFTIGATTLVVQDVTSKSTRNAGLKRYDRVLEVDGVAVKTLDE